MSGLLDDPPEGSNHTKCKNSFQGQFRINSKSKIMSQCRRLTPMRVVISLLKGKLFFLANLGSLYNFGVVGFFVLPKPHEMQVSNLQDF